MNRDGERIVAEEKLEATPLPGVVLRKEFGNNNQNSRRLVSIGGGPVLVPGERLGPDRWPVFVMVSYLFRF